MKKSRTAAILGAGILGRSLAFRLSQLGIKVSVFEKEAEPGETSASFLAAGMLAPFCESEHAPQPLAKFGLESIRILKAWANSLPGKWLHTQGTLVVAHHRDQAELKKLCDRLESLGLNESYIENNYGLFFPNEAHVEAKMLLAVLKQVACQLGAKYYFLKSINEYSVLSNYDFIFDCRGLGAQKEMKKLRGVRGEIIEVYCQEVQVKNPVRLMHPKYPLYIVPLSQQRFLIGATVVETESLAPMTLKSAAELLSVAMTVHPAFSEGHILNMNVQCRPTFDNHLPQVNCQGNVIQINGLYRHGYLLTPYIVEKIIEHIDENKIGDGKCLNIF